MTRNNGLLTPEEVADYLRANRFTIYRWVFEKKMPAIKVGNQLRFKRSLLERWQRDFPATRWESSIVSINPS